MVLLLGALGLYARSELVSAARKQARPHPSHLSPTSRRGGAGPLLAGSRGLGPRGTGHTGRTGGSACGGRSRPSCGGGGSSGPLGSAGRRGRPHTLAARCWLGRGGGGGAAERLCHGRRATLGWRGEHRRRRLDRLRPPRRRLRRRRLRRRRRFRRLRRLRLRRQCRCRRSEQGLCLRQCCGRDGGGRWASDGRLGGLRQRQGLARQRLARSLALGARLVRVRVRVRARVRVRVRGRGRGRGRVRVRVRVPSRGAPSRSRAPPACHAA